MFTLFMVIAGLFLTIAILGAVTLTVDGTLNVNARAQGTGSGLSSNFPVDSVLANILIALTNGTAINQADLYYAPATQSISNGANLDIDLSGSVVNGLGQTVTMARVKMILIRNNTLTAGFKAVIGNGSNPFINWVGAAAHTLNVGPGGIFFLYAPDVTGYPVAGGTGDILRINNSNASAISVDVLIIGASA